MVRMGFPECLELVWRTGVFQAATGVQIRKDNDLVRRKDFRSIRHELHATKGNHLCIRCLSLAG